MSRNRHLVDEGDLNIDQQGAIARLATLGTNITAILQALQNALDASASTVRIYWEPRSKDIVIVDNGFGILGTVPDHDKNVLDEFARRSRSQRTGGPFHDFVKPTSAMSMQYMMKSAGASVKRDRQFYQMLMSIIEEGGFRLRPGSKDSRGVFGIGFLEQLGVSDKVEIYSKACLSLAQAHYADLDIQREKDVPTFKLLPPGKYNDFTTYSVEHVPDGLTAPYQRRPESLPHGTVIHMHNVGNLNFAALEQQIHQEFGFLIARGIIRVEMVEVKYDKRSSEDPTLSHHFVDGLKIYGKRLQIEGYDTLVLTSGPFKAEVELYLVLKEKRLIPVSFVRKGLLGDPVTKLSGYFGNLWDEPFLSGTIEIVTPENEDDADFWDAEKHSPVPTGDPDLENLLLQLGDLEEYIRAAIEELKKKAEDERVKQIADLVNQVLGDLVTREFNLDLPGQARTGDKPGSKSGKSKGVKEREPQLRVFVINEHGEFVGAEVGIAIELMFGKNRRRMMAGSIPVSHGPCRLQNLKSGLYAIKLILPDDVQLAHKQDQLVWVDYNEEQGIDVMMYVITGEEEKMRNRVGNNVSVNFLSLGEEQPPWDNSMLVTTGAITYNIDYPPFAKAYEREDYRRMAHILAGSLVFAVAEIVYRGQITRDILQSTERLGHEMAEAIISNWKK